MSTKIKVLNVPARAHDGPSTGRAKYYFQKIKVSSLDRDGEQAIQTLDIISNLDAVLEPADDYIVDPRNARVNSYKDEKNRDRRYISLGFSSRLIRIGDFIARENKALKADKAV